MGRSLLTPANLLALVTEAGVISGSIVSVIGAVRYLPRLGRLLFHHGRIIAENIDLREINADLRRSITDSKEIIGALTATQDAWRDMYGDLNRQIDTLQQQIAGMHGQIEQMTKRQSEMGVLLAASTEYIVDLTHAAETQAPLPPVPAELREAVEVVRHQRAG